MKRALSTGFVFLFVLFVSHFVAADINNHVYITEQSDHVLNVSVELFGVNYDYGPTCASTSNPCVAEIQQDFEKDVWLIGSVNGDMPLAFLGGPNWWDYPYINWVEPDNPNRYNTVHWVPSGNHGNTGFVVSSDIDSPNYNVLTGDNNLMPCQIDATLQPIQCPILANGDSIELGVFNYAGLHESMTLRFTDQSDSGTAPVPEPGAFWLMGSVLTGLAGVFRRRS